MRTLLLALSLGLVTAGVSGQQNHSLIVSPDISFVLQNTTVPQAMGLVDDQESLITTPSAVAPYQANPFRTFTTINVMQGDGDNNSQLADTDRYGDLNALMVRRRPPHAETGPFEPGSLWMSHSFNTAGAVATTTGIQRLQDGDVYRCRNGVNEFFVREPDLSGALPPGGLDIDIDCMVQDRNGDLYFSLWESLAYSTSTATSTYYDGDLLYIPANAITYDANGLISAIQPNSALIFAKELDFSGMVRNSGAVSQTGAALTSIGDLGAMDLDPNGGTWTSPLLGIQAPNFVFASNFATRFDNLWTTANGGQLATINGKMMGYQAPNLADGTVLGVGIVPAQDGINALVIVPEQHDWIAIDQPQSGLPVGGTFTVEIGRCQPNSTFSLLMSIWNNDVPGGWVSGFPLPLPFGGNPLLELDLFTMTSVTNLAVDANGYASLSFADPGGVPSGVELLIQGVGHPFGAVFPLALSATSNITFP